MLCTTLQAKTLPSLSLKPPSNCRSRPMCGMQNNLMNCNHHLKNISKMEEDRIETIRVYHL